MCVCVCVCVCVSSLYVSLCCLSDSADAIATDLIAAGLLEMKDMIVGKSCHESIPHTVHVPAMNLYHIL